jgi:multidrug efflux pump subunit AcrB
MAPASDAVGGIISYFTRHRTAANLVMLLMVVVGLLAASRIRAQYFPDIVVSEVSVSVSWQGAGADDVDRAIVQVMEPALLAVEGVVDVTSLATEGSARMSMEFEPGVDVARAAEDVQTAIEAMRDLRADAEDPVVRRGAWRDLVTDVVITGPVGIDQLGRFADEFVARLFEAGVTRATIQGYAAPQIVVEVPSVALMRYDLTMAEIAAAIAAEVSATPAGDVGEGTARVRTGTEKRSAEQIADIVLRSLSNGTVLTLGDVASVRVDGPDRGRASFVGQNPAINIRVDRNAEGDAIALQATVDRVAAELQPSLPPGVTLDLVRKRSEQISDRLNLLQSNALSGLLLLLGVLFLFLNARTAFWVAMGIPVATLAAIAVMYMAGLTLNMISMFALILILGVIVDDSIVVSEHAEYRMRVLGEDPVSAAENASRRMAGPVLASTLTTVIAFFGLVAIGGPFGELIADIPFTVIAVMLVSLIECFLILPNHLAHAMAKSAQERWYDWPSKQVNRGMVWLQSRVMKPLMRGVIAARYPVLAAAIVALAFQASLFIRGDVQFRFFNPPEQSSVTGNFAMRPGANRKDTYAMMREVQRATQAVAESYETDTGVNPVTFVMAEVGGSSGRGWASADTKAPDLLGGVSIELVNPDLRPFSSFAFVAALQEEVRAHPMLEEISFRGGQFGPGGSALSVDLYGATAPRLKQAAEAIKAALMPFPEVSGLEDTLAYDKDELSLNLTPQGQALGFTIDDLGRELRDRLNGIEAATYPDGQRSAAIRVGLPATELTADFLDSTLMKVGTGVYVPLADIVTVTRQSGFSTVRRENGLRIVTVSGDLAEDDPARATEIQRILAEEIIPKVEADFGVVSRVSGLAAQEDEFLGDAGIALILVLTGMYLCLAWTFGSWTRPFVVMSVIPFGLVGAIWGHYVWNVPLSLFSVVGLIGMTGIIVNDSIVLVSTVDEYSEKRGLIPAIVDGVSDRLRPVLLTTLTTIIGLAPLLYDTSSQSGFLKPTIVTLVYGLGFGMFLVLLVVPAFLVVQSDIGRAIAAFRRGLWRGPRRITWAVSAAVMGLFAVTLVPVMITGRLADSLTRLIPSFADIPARIAGFGLFVMAAALLVLAGYLVGWVVLRKRTA